MSLSLNFTTVVFHDSGKMLNFYVKCVFSIGVVTKYMYKYMENSKYEPT